MPNEGGTVESTVPEELVPFITEFTFRLGGDNVRITRRDNHGGLVVDGGWVVVKHNEWYLNRGEWVYKNGTTWASPTEAFAALRAAQLDRPQGGEHG